MCSVCQQIWCTPWCPEYDVSKDPAVTGFCEICGDALYGVGMKRCYKHEDVDEKDSEDDED